MEILIERGREVRTGGLRYGLDVTTTAFGPRGVIGEITRDNANNVIIYVGRETADGWTLTERISLTQAEAEDLIASLAWNTDVVAMREP